MDECKPLLLGLKNQVFDVIKSLTLDLSPKTKSGGVGASQHGNLRAGRKVRQDTFYADLFTLAGHMGVERLVAANAISAILDGNRALCKRLPRGRDQRI